ncbi:hypothetical protein BDQ17DRAFT_1434986 [Cyathus striatus]|nr:hypothetical protein BDQ17DRAFT_1434986 [Cyathus striatus]
MPSASSNAGPSHIPLCTPENPRTLSQILQQSQPLSTPLNITVPSTPRNSTSHSFSERTPTTPATLNDSVPSLFQAPDMDLDSDEELIPR